MKRPLSILFIWIITALLMQALAACQPSLTREQLTPSPTISTPRPSRTPDPNQQLENLATPDVTREQQAAATLLPAVSSIGPLLIEEFPLDEEGTADLQPGSSQQNEAFAESLPEDIRSGHPQIGADNPPTDLGEANAALEPAGYQLQKFNKTLRLVQNGDTVEQCLLLDAFRTWEEHWVLELDGDVLMDGQRLTEQRSFDAVFNWQAPAGQELFLYQKGSEYGIFFDGRAMPQTYDEIVRWNCADQQNAQGFNFSAQGSDAESGFFARKGGRWYYVRITTLE